MRRLYVFRHLWGPILSPWHGEEAGHGVGFSYQPARLCSLGGLVQKIRRHSRLHPPSQGLRIWLEKNFKVLSYHLKGVEGSRVDSFDPCTDKLECRHFSISFQGNPIPRGSRNNLAALVWYLVWLWLVKVTFAIIFCSITWLTEPTRLCIMIILYCCVLWLCAPGIENSSELMRFLSQFTESQIIQSHIDLQNYTRIYRV